MSKFGIGDPVSANEELAALLEYNGIRCKRTGDDFSFLFSDSGMKWKTVCRCEDDWIGIYGMYPFPVEDEEKALALCSEINSQVMTGGMFVKDGAVVFRTGNFLPDVFTAYETIGRALEYNASVITGFWRKMAACSVLEQKDTPIQAIKQA